MGISPNRIYALAAALAVAALILALAIAESLGAEGRPPVAVIAPWFENVRAVAALAGDNARARASPSAGPSRRNS